MLDQPRDEQAVIDSGRVTPMFRTAMAVPGDPFALPADHAKDG